MGLFLAIDSGGTKAEYVLANGHEVLARVVGGTLKRMRASEEEASRNLRSAAAELRHISGRSLRDVTCTCIGTAGDKVPLVTDWLRLNLRQHIGGELIVTGDVDIALDAAFPDAPGILILAGTGSNVAGRGANGHFANAGGYGPVLSDQGSGHHIGLQALRAMFLARDEERQSSLLHVFLEHWSLANVDELVAHANACPPEEFSALTPLVLGCALEGDEVAAQVLKREGEELAYLALLVNARLQAEDEKHWQPRFAFSGSVLREVSPLREALMARIRKDVPYASFQGLVEPTDGALWRARNWHKAHEAALADGASA